MLINWCFFFGLFVKLEIINCSLLIILLIGDCNLWVVWVKKLVLNLFILEVIWYVSWVFFSCLNIFFSFLEFDLEWFGII